MCNWTKDMPQKPAMAGRGSLSAQGAEAAGSRGNWFGRAPARRFGDLPAHRATPHYIGIHGTLRVFSRSRFEQEVIMTDEIERLMSQATRLGSLGAAARRQGEEAAADASFRDAWSLARDAANQAAADGSHPARLDAWKVAARFALDCGEVLEARRLMDEAFSAEASTRF